MNIVFTEECAADGCYNKNIGNGKQMCEMHQAMYENGTAFKAFYGKTVLKKIKKHSVTEECPHNIAEIKVLDSIATCETTVIICSNCGEHLSKPKTET